MSNLKSGLLGRRTLVEALRQHITPKLGLSLALWRFEAALATPLALLLVATIGRWNGALVMGLTMAFFSALFLFLLNGESALLAFRDWMHDRPLVQRIYQPVVRARGLSALLVLLLALPVIVLLIGPFWRAILLHSFSPRKEISYLISVLGSIPHSLLWTGLVLGGIWEGLVWPLLDSHVF